MCARFFPAFLLILTCLAASPALARPVAVTLYPSGALVTEEESVKPQDGRVSLRLPAGADTSSLIFTLSQGTVLSRTVSRLPGEPSPAVAALQREADALRDAISLKQAELANTSAMRQFWSQPPYSLSAPSVEMANSLMEIFSRESRAKLDDIAQEEARIHDELRTLHRQVEAIEARIRALGTENAEQRLCVLDVQDTGFGQVTLRWSYWLAGANWSPRYRLAADTMTGQVRIRMDAAITQNSGTDWNGVELTLASAEQLGRVEPPSLRPWMLDAAPAVYAARANMLMKSAASGASAEAAPAVMPSSEAAGLLWKPGRADIASGTTVTRLLSEHVFPAAIQRLMRPTRSPDAWIEARFDGAVSRALPLLPAGQAAFLVDGVENARGTFRLTPGSRTVSFGLDQLIRADVTEIAPESASVQTADAASKPRGSSEKASVDVRQWAWNIVIRSAHPEAVVLRVEESAPLPREADASVSVVTSPAAVLDADKSRYVWELELPARDSLGLRYEVKAVFPRKEKP